MQAFIDFFKALYNRYFSKIHLPSTDVQSGLPMVIETTAQKKSQNFVERFTQKIKDFWSKKQ